MLMKKLLVLLVALVVVAFIACSLITVQTNNTVIVRSSMINTARALSQPSMWQKWQPLLSASCNSKTGCNVIVDSASSSFSIQSGEITVKVLTQGLIFTVTETGRHTAEYCYIVVPTKKPDSTQIVIAAQQSLLKSWLHGLNGPVIIAVDSLKSFLETPAKFYGYNIERRIVTDTIVAVTNKVFAAADKFNQMALIHKQLTDYVTTSGLTEVQPVMMHFVEKGKDSSGIMMGIPVNKLAPQKQDALCVKMPKGNLLTATYTGSFAGRTAIYNAMEAYLRDHFMQKAAASYEKYLDNKLPVNDSSNIKIQVNIPVY